jgi:hypothetical protein
VIDRPIIVFDVNEMLPDHDTVRPTFERIVGKGLV